MRPAVGVPGDPSQSGGYVTYIHSVNLAERLVSPTNPYWGVGFCIGLGSMDTSWNLKNSPSKLTLSLVHSSFRISRLSSIIFPLDESGTPMASNSALLHPTPNPTINRPFERKSIVASDLASQAG